MYQRLANIDGFLRQLCAMLVTIHVATIIIQLWETNNIKPGFAINYLLKLIRNCKYSYQSSKFIPYSDLWQIQKYRYGISTSSRLAISGLTLSISRQIAEFVCQSTRVQTQDEAKSVSFTFSPLFYMCILFCQN